MNSSNIDLVSPSPYQLTLRRADWRFLTLNPFPLKSICFENGLLAQAVELISDSVLNPEYGSNDCDLAVAVNPDKEIIDQSFLRLRPGGCSYFEWNIGSLENVKSIQSLLQIAGFSEVKIYLPKYETSYSSPQMWIPLYDRNIIKFILNKSHKRRKYTSFLSRYLIYLRNIVWKIKPDLFMNYPALLDLKIKDHTVASIAFKSINGSLDKSPDTKSYKDFYTAFLKNLKNEFKKLSPNSDLETTSSLLLTKGSHVANKIVFLLFDNQISEPVVVIKTPRYEEAGLAIINETNTLKSVQDLGVPGTPKIISEHTENGFVISAQTYISKSFLTNVINARNFHENALKATSWLVELAKKPVLLFRKDGGAQLLIQLLINLNLLLIKS